jgi:hypothetical protein
MKRTLVFALLCTALYVLLFSKPLRTEPVISPAWVESLSSPRPAAGPPTQASIGFRMGDIFGYTTPTGGIQYLNVSQFEVQMDGNRFINFSSVPQNLVMRDSSGRILSSIESQGYPILTAGRYFVINTDRTELMELTDQGDTKWQNDFGSMITCMGATKALAVVGLLDGSIAVVDGSGRTVTAYAPGGSRVQVIYGCAISDDGSRIALVSGLDPQKLVLLSRARGGYRPYSVLNLETSFRSAVFVNFLPGVPYVYYEGAGSAGYVSISGRQIGTLPLRGTVRAVSLGPKSLLFLLSSSAADSSGKGPQSELTVVRPPNSIVARSTFPGGNLFLRSIGSAIYLGVDRTLMRLNYADE